MLDWLQDALASGSAWIRSAMIERGLNLSTILAGVAVAILLGGVLRLRGALWRSATWLARKIIGPLGRW